MGYNSPEFRQAINEVGHGLNVQLLPFVRQLVEEMPRLRGIFDEHLEDNGGDVLPYLLFESVIQRLDKEGSPHDWATLARMLNGWYDLHNRQLETLIVLAPLQAASLTKSWATLRPLLRAEWIEQLNQTIDKPT